jgi:uncharacterized membrane protein
MSKKYRKNEAGVNRAEIRKREQTRRKQNRNKLMIMSSIVLIAIIGIVIVFTVFSSPNEDIQNKDNTYDPSNVVTGSQISIPISDISSTAKYYSYDADGIEVKYFAVKGTDGEIHVALDACDVCYGAKKGYAQVGDIMQCINCGNQYPINSLGTENTRGGCWPSYLPIKLDGDNILINESDLKDKKYMFA